MRWGVADRDERVPPRRRAGVPRASAQVRRVLPVVRALSDVAPGRPRLPLSPLCLPPPVGPCGTPPSDASDASSPPSTAGFAWRKMEEEEDNTGQTRYFHDYFTA